MKDYKAKVSDHLTKSNSEKRYVVVDVETDEILDNNDGHGYKSENSALTSYELKHFGKTSSTDEKLKTKRRRADVKRKLEAHKPSLEELEEMFNG